MSDINQSCNRDIRRLYFCVFL